MPYDPTKHHRRSIRLRGYDYAAQGAYFVTICVQGRICVLGDVFDGDMRLNDWGAAAAETWLWLADQYSYVNLDAWVVMPNHMHGIIVLEAGGLPEYTIQKRKQLGRLIGAFKTVSTKRINAMRGSSGAVFWQRDFWEHIIRNDNEFNRIRNYIQTNPAGWSNDQLHPQALPNQFNQG